jgi:hypothetical protein
MNRILDKTLVRFLVLCLGLAISAPSYAREDFDFSFLGFLSSRLLGSLGFRIFSILCFNLPVQN